jgi:hypothetical protein
MNFRKNATYNGKIILNPVIVVEWDMLSAKGKIIESNIGFVGYNVMNASNDYVKVRRFSFSQPQILSFSNLKVIKNYKNEEEFRQQYRVQKKKETK